MKPAIILSFLALSAGVAAGTAFVPSAHAQVPPQNILGDRDRDGVPNVFDPTNNNRRPQAWGDRDHDGVPNTYDRHDNRQQAWGDRDRDRIPNRYDTDRDGDGVPNTWDRNAGNPYRR